jgi:hypothetical protein
MKTVSGARPALTLASLALALLTARPARADLIVNGDFEAGNVGFTSGYRYSPGNILDTGTYDVVTDPLLSQPFATSYGDHTTGSGRMLAVNGAEVPDLVVWSQTVAVDPGTDYAFSAWASSWFSLSPARLDFLFNGVSVGQFTAPLAAGVWARFAAAWNSGASASLTITIVDRNTDFSGNDFALDDLSLNAASAPAAVPGPAGLSLLAVGALGVSGYGWRRRRKG